MSDLPEYLTKTGLKQAAFAQRIGVTQVTVSKLIARTMLPGLELAVRIEDATCGQVPARSWVSPSDPASPPEISPQKDVA